MKTQFHKTIGTEKQKSSSINERSACDINTTEQLFENLISSLKQTFSLDEAAEYLRVDTKTVEYYSKRTRELSYIPLSKGVLVFRKVDLDEFLEKKLRRGIVHGD